MASPPLSPLPDLSPTKSISPQHSRRSINRRSSSFSSVASITLGRRRSVNSNRRLSNSSHFSNGYDDFSSPVDQRHRTASGMATLADELDSADEDGWDEEQEADMSYIPEGEQVVDTAGIQADDRKLLIDPTQIEGAQDSGVDVEYEPPPKSVQHVRKVSRAAPARTEEDFPMELDLAIKDVADLAHASTMPQADTTLRTISALRDLHPQADLEASTQRLATSMNSISSFLSSQIKIFQSSTSTIFSPLAPPLDPAEASELATAIAALSQTLPTTDPSTTAQFTRLARDTADLQQSLSSLLDSLQLARQLGTTAARATRSSLAMAVDLRREADRAEVSAATLDAGRWHQRLADRWCAEQCRDVVEGFEGVCDGLRADIEASAG